MAYVNDSPKTKFREHTTNSKIWLDSLEQALKLNIQTQHDFLY